MYSVNKQDHMVTNFFHYLTILMASEQSGQDNDSSGERRKHIVLNTQAKMKIIHQLERGERCMFNWQLNLRKGCFFVTRWR